MIGPRLARWLRALVPLGLYAGVIFALSSQPSLTAKLPRFPHADKVVHAVEYSGFGFLAARAVGILVPRGPAFAAGMAILAGACYGATDELHQRFVPGRDSDPWDLLGDLAGSALGATAYLAWIRARRRRSPDAVPGPGPREAGAEPRN